jgi:hypothetical protein
METREYLKGFLINPNNKEFWAKYEALNSDSHRILNYLAEHNILLGEAPLLHRDGSIIYEVRIIGERWACRLESNYPPPEGLTPLYEKYAGKLPRHDLQLYASSPLSQLANIVEFLEFLDLPLELKLTDSRVWVRFLAQVEIGTKEVRNPYVREMYKFLHRKNRGDPIPWE